MKLIRIPFIVAFIVASMALGMAYVSGIRRDAEPTDYLWYDALQELNELGRAKYRQSRRYNDYAHRAELDSLHSQAALLRALAYADNVQCENCRKAGELAHQSRGNSFCPAGANVRRKLQAAFVVR